MPLFLLIETSSLLCSAALSENDKIIASREVQEPKAHAKLLASMIKELLEETNHSMNDISAVSVSEGPGSYTGLRVGVSTAKGLCFGADKPLLSVSTTDILAQIAINNKEKNNSQNSTLIIPMIDARRMEVYCANYNVLGERLTPINAKILDSDSFKEEFSQFSHIIFIGDGAEKFRTCLSDEEISKSSFISCYPSASHMAISTLAAWNSKDFKDVAYFEPFYLKEFVAGVSKKATLL